MVKCESYKIPRIPIYTIKLADLTGNARACRFSQSDHE